MEVLIAVLWAGLGSAAGAAARFFLSSLCARTFGVAFPWGTLAVNASGAFAIGLMAALAANGALPGMPATWQALVVGVLGGYTTVSSFSLETLALAQAGAFGRAGGNLAASLGAGLLAVCLGYAAGTAACA